LEGLSNASQIDDINRMNARVDDPFVHPNYDPREHFDNSLILESIALLEDRLCWSGETHLATVSAGSHQEAAYGLALHAIADFYAHSNFVPMVLACFGGKAQSLPTLDEAIASTEFVQFIQNSWQNSSMWQDHSGYSATKRFRFSAGFAKCLFTGGYGGDGWIPREDVPHHNVFAIDQRDSALVHAPEIQGRQHPFAFPGEWFDQYTPRITLATRHVKSAMERMRAGDPKPFLGHGQSLPAVLVPPDWAIDGTSVASARQLPIRRADGWLMEGIG
jgi:hypothetical protein